MGFALSVVVFRGDDCEMSTWFRVGGEIIIVKSEGVNLVGLDIEAGDGAHGEFLRFR
jgi:hypothetical protein